MTTRDELQQAFLKCRRATDVATATKLIADHGGDSLDTVPENRRDDLIRAFLKAAGEELAPKTLDEIAPAAYQRWNKKR